MVTWHSALGGFAYIWQSKWAGIIAVKTKRTQIHFLSDVPVAVASLDLKVPTVYTFVTVVAVLTVITVVTAVVTIVAVVTVVIFPKILDASAALLRERCR